MPWGLKRLQNLGCGHFITFSCYRRLQNLSTAKNRDTFEAELERVRRWYGMCVYGYVVMPEHVHLLVGEPERARLSLAMQMLKQITSRKMRRAGQYRFWQIRHDDTPLWSAGKKIEKLRYMHRNPVKRGLVKSPEQWKWSSFHHYWTGEREWWRSSPRLSPRDAKEWGSSLSCVYAVRELPILRQKQAEGWGNQH